MNRGIIIYCGLLMGLSAFSMDITLPAFSDIARDLNAAPEQVQWSITIFTIGIGFGALPFGILSDWLGRRPAVAIGLLIYMFGGFLAVFAQSGEMLLFGRALQGFGVATAVVNSRAIIRDLFTGADLARNLSYATAVFAIGPIIAPLLGAGIAWAFGWHMIYIAISAVAFILILFLLRMPETRSAERQKHLAPSVILGKARAVMGNTQSRYFMLLGAVSQASMILIVSGAPRVYESAFGVTGATFAVLFALHGFGIIIGQFANRAFIRKFGPEKALVYSSLILVLATVLMIGTDLAGIMSAYVLTALLILFATGFLSVIANATGLVLDPHGKIAGFTSSFQICVMQIISGVIVSTAALFTGDGVLGWAVTLFCICVLVTLSGWAWIRRSEPVAQ